MMIIMTMIMMIIMTMIMIIQLHNPQSGVVVSGWR